MPELTIIYNLVLSLFLLMMYTNAGHINEIAQQRESNTATANVLAKQQTELNANAHQSVDAKLARNEQRHQVLLLLLQNDKTSHPLTNDNNHRYISPYYNQGYYPRTHIKYQFRVGNRSIDYPIIVATSPDVVQTLVDQHTLLAAALFQSVDTTDWLTIQAEREAEVNAIANQTAMGNATDINTKDTIFRQIH